MKRPYFLLAADLRRHRPQLGLSEQRMEILPMAGVARDICIVNVADSLLSKRGRLSVKKMQLVR